MDAAELVHHTLYGGLRGRRVGDVAADPDGTRAFGQLVARLRGRVLVEVEERDGRALGGETLRDAEADAARGSGDDCDPSVETTHLMTPED